MSIPNKTLVIRLSSIGDIVLASPLIRVLRLRFPSSQIDFAVRKEYSELIQYNQNVNHIIEFDVREGIDGLYRLAKKIRHQKYDLIVDIHGSLRSRFIQKFSGAKKVFVVNKRIFARTMLVKFKKYYYRDIISEAYPTTFV